MNLERKGETYLPLVGDVDSELEVGASCESLGGRFTDVEEEESLVDIDWVLVVSVWLFAVLDIDNVGSLTVDVVLSCYSCIDFSVPDLIKTELYRSP